MPRDNSRIVRDNSRIVRESGKNSKGKQIDRATKRPEVVSETNERIHETAGIALDLQQKSLNTFRDTLLPSAEDQSILQEVKGHLFNRDFTAAFGREDYLRVYAARWSPSRALGYGQILTDLEDHVLNAASSAAHSAGDGHDTVVSTYRIVCVGGGAGAELVGVATWLRSRIDNAKRPSNPHFHLTLIDIAAWDGVSARLHSALLTPPTLSKYASAAAKETNQAMVSEDVYAAQFVQEDIFGMDEEAVRTHFSNAGLVTLMFTLNELYSESAKKTQQFLARLTGVTQPGTLLLVVDSPGSYSTVSVNGAETKYPMAWLLDIAILGGRPGKAADPSVAKWEKLVTDASRWFRLAPSLQYPIDLENMRYQIHLYKRLGVSCELGE